MPESLRPKIDASSIAVATLRAPNTMVRSTSNEVFVAIGGIGPLDRTHVFLSAASQAEEFLRGKQNPDDSWKERPIIAGAGNVIGVFERARKVSGPMLPSANVTGNVDEVIDGFAGADGFATGPYARAISERKIITRENILGLWVQLTMIVGGAWSLPETK